MSSNISVVILLGISVAVGGLYVVKDECPPNEEYLLCGSACPFNCTDPEGPVACSEECVEGCFCKSGYLRGDNGTCVTSNQCFRNQTLCNENEEFLECGTACPLTCSQPSEPDLCDLSCNMGCFCKSGFVRDETNNACVTLDNCPAEQCLSPNEVFDQCNANCEPSCADPLPICVKSCTAGCVCASGLFRNGTGECVSVEKCPPGNSTAPGLLNKYMNVINRILHLSTV